MHSWRGHKHWYYNTHIMSVMWVRWVSVWKKKKKRCKNFIITRFHVKKIRNVLLKPQSGADLFFLKKILNSYPSRLCKTIHVDRNCVMMHWQWRNKPQKVKIEKVSKQKSFEHSYQIRVVYIFIHGKWSKYHTYLSVFGHKKYSILKKRPLEFLKFLKTN